MAQRSMSQAMPWSMAMPTMPGLFPMPGMFAPYFMFPNQYMEAGCSWPKPSENNIPTTQPVKEEVEDLSPPSKIRRCDDHNSSPDQSNRINVPDTKPKSRSTTKTAEKPLPQLSYIADVSNQPNNERLPLVSHSREAPIERDFECGQCRMRTRSHHGLKRHLDSHSKKHLPERPAVCFKCREQFKNVFDLYYHVLTHNEGDSNNNNGAAVSNNLQKCPEVPSAAPELYLDVGGEDDDECDSAETRKSIPRYYECGECGLRVRSHYGLRRHFRRHISVCALPAVCGICKSAFPNTHQLQEHVLGHIVVKTPQLQKRLRRLACKKCHESFLSADMLTQHMLTHRKL